MQGNLNTQSSPLCKPQQLPMVLSIISCDPSCCARFGAVEILRIAPNRFSIEKEIECGAWNKCFPFEEQELIH